MTEPQGPWSRPPASAPQPRPRSRLGFGLWIGLLAATGVIFVLLAWLMPAERGDLNWPEAIRLFGVLALVSAGLARVQRVNLSATAKIAAGWLAIFLLAVTGYALRDDVARLARKVGSALVPSHAMAVAPRSVVVTRGEGGAFYVVGAVDGVAVRFVVDTGSTDIVLSPTDAARIGLHPAPDAYTNPSQTANGVGYGAAAVVRSLAVGPIGMTDLPVSINKAPMSDSLLGMPFLSRLDSYEVRGDELFLRGKD